MINLSRDIMVMLKGESLTEDDIQHEVDMLNQMLSMVESPVSFCNAHELVNRNRITTKRKKILKECKLASLRPFIFLINKN